MAFMFANTNKPLGVPKQPCCRPRPTCLIAFWRSSRTQWLMRVVLLRGILSWLAVVLIIRIMLQIEQRKVGKTPETLYLYEGSEVCGLKVPKDYYTQPGFLMSNPVSIETQSEDAPYQNYSDFHVAYNNKTDEQLLTQEYNNTDHHNNSDHNSIQTQHPTEEIQFQTFATASEAREDDSIVGHCGECGACSNPHDIAIYDDTKQSLFSTSTTCAKHGLIWGRKTATKCMEEKVGFTDDCTYCWVENIMCDLRYCVFSCLWQTMFNEIDKGDSQALNRCTECDERRCGVEFVKCAGANRRRTGIVSDIDRDMENEVCQVVDDQWWKSEGLQNFYARTTMLAEEQSRKDRRNKKSKREKEKEDSEMEFLLHPDTRKNLRE